MSDVSDLGELELFVTGFTAVMVELQVRTTFLQYSLLSSAHANLLTLVAYYDRNTDRIASYPRTIYALRSDHLTSPLFQVLGANGDPFHLKMAERCRRWLGTLFSEEERIRRGLGDQTREEAI